MIRGATACAGSCRHRWASLSALPLAAILLAGAPAAPLGAQVAVDPGFDTHVAKPAFTAPGPAVCFDEAHHNLHTAGGRYAPFAALLAADGCRVLPSAESVTPERLAGCRLFVTANAQGAPDPAAPAFAAAEITALVTWVERGGALLLIVDHPPFGAASAELGRAFGVGLLDGNVQDEEHWDKTLPGADFLLFERQSGLLGDHPILAGRDPAERVTRVVTFGGEALELPATAVPLLRFGAGARSYRDAEHPRPEEMTPVGGKAQMAALEIGRGRVVVLGEAGIFSAQVLSGPPAEAMGRKELRFGMNHPGTDDRQLALNTVRWLLGAL